jgi:hypothetical protein
MGPEQGGKHDPYPFVALYLTVRISLIPDLCAINDANFVAKIFSFMR